LKITRCTILSGGASKQKYTHDTESRKRFALSVVTVSVGRNLCLPAALYLGQYRLTHNIKKGEVHYRNWMNLIRKSAPKKLEKAAAELVHKCGLQVGQKFNLKDDLEKFCQNLEKFPGDDHL
jgi:hypothetical protein